MFNSVAQSVADNDRPKKIVFIAGTDSHPRGQHEFRAGCHLLARLLNESVSGVQAVVTEDGWPKDTTLLDDADVILMYSDGGSRHMVLPHLRSVDKLVEKGVGLIALHYAIEVPKDRPGMYFSKWFGGYFETFYSVNPFFTPEFSPYPEHPIVKGVNPLAIEDEWYYHLRFADTKKLSPILTAHPPMSTLLEEPTSIRGNNEFVRRSLEAGKIQTMAWAFDRPDGGRSFAFTGGHYHANWANDNFRKLILNAIVWAAKLDVPETGVVTQTPTSVEMEYLVKEK